MKYYLTPVLSLLFMVSAKAADKDSTVNYYLPDSVKAVQFMAEINVQDINNKKFLSCGIKTDAVTLILSSYKGKRSITFWVTNIAASGVVARGANVTGNPKGWFEYRDKQGLSKTYKLMIAVATDSAENFSIYTGYAWLPEQSKWKLIASCKIKGRWNTLQESAVFYSQDKKKAASVDISQVWCQRSTGSWKNMKDESLPPPTINLFGHIDSVQQHQTDIKIIEDAIASGKTDAKEIAEGIYYKIIKEGNGKQVSLNDTVTVNYRLSLFNDTAVIQQTKDEPATFPLKRLIKGWQIGVPLCKVGGKIKLVIPSDLAYSIRTRAADIPPNSILVFEIEVLDAKSPL